MTKASIIKEMTKEWIEESKGIICGFAATPDELPEIFLAIADVSEALEEANGFWRAIYYNPDDETSGSGMTVLVEICPDKHLA